MIKGVFMCFYLVIFISSTAQAVELGEEYPGFYPMIAMNTFCPYKTSQSEVAEIISSHLENIDELASINDFDLEVRYYDDDEYFMKTFLPPLDVLRKPNKRKYYLDINVRLYECSPTKKALVAILAHELFHIKDYTSFKTKDFFSLIWKIKSKPGRAEYEIGTDIKAFALGEDYAIGLKEYREWIYKKLTEKQLKKKRFFYLTPEEIDDMLDGDPPPARANID